MLKQNWIPPPPEGSKKEAFKFAICLTLTYGTTLSRLITLLLLLLSLLLLLLLREPDPCTDFALHTDDVGGGRGRWSILFFHARNNTSVVYRRYDWTARTWQPTRLQQRHTRQVTTGWCNDSIRHGCNNNNNKKKRKKNHRYDVRGGIMREREPGTVLFGAYLSRVSCVACA